MSFSEKAANAVGGLEHTFRGLVGGRWPVKLRPHIKGADSEIRTHNVRFTGPAHSHLSFVG